MSCYVYILYSELHDRFYIGHSSDLGQRVQRHNEGKTFSTAPYRPWKLVYSQEFPTRGEAMKRERRLKRRKSRTVLLKLCSSGDESVNLRILKNRD